MTWLLFALFLLTLSLWGDSYVLCRQYLWGDRHRGNYVFVTSSYGNLFLERRSNCDVSHHFTRNHQWAYGYGAWRPATSREFLGFGYYSGTRYCWYAHLYPVTTLPAFSDPRWQKEPYRMVRIPYWPVVLLAGGLSLPWLPRRIRAWRARRDARRARRGLCTQCGYNLTGNTSGVCPECGEKIRPRQPDQPSSVRVKLVTHRNGWRRLLVLAVISAAIALVTFAAAWANYQHSLVSGRAVYGSALIHACVFLALFVALPLLLAVLSWSEQRWWYAIVEALAVWLGVAAGMLSHGALVSGSLPHPRALLTPETAVLLAVYLAARILALVFVRFLVVSVEYRETGPCPSCTHGLAGNTPGVCPECGRPV